MKFNPMHTENLYHKHQKKMGQWKTDQMVRNTLNWHFPGLKMTKITDQLG